MAQSPDKDGSKTPVTWAYFNRCTAELIKLVREHVTARMRPLEDRIAELESRKSLEYRGVWNASTEYGVSDLTTHSGQLWLCQRQGTRSKPGDGDAWPRLENGSRTMSADDKTFDFTPDEQALADGIAELIGKLPLVPEGIIERIYSAEYAEDRETFIIWLDMADGREVYMSLCPGSPIKISIS